MTTGPTRRSVLAILDRVAVLLLARVEDPVVEITADLETEAELLWLTF